MVIVALEACLLCCSGSAQGFVSLLLDDATGDLSPGGLLMTDFAQHAAENCAELAKALCQVGLVQLILMQLEWMEGGLDPLRPYG